MNGLKVTGKRSKLKTPIHPYLFALYPALSYLSHNISAIDILQIWRTFIASLMLVIGIWLIFGFLMRSKERAAIVSSLIILLLLSYGQTYLLLSGKRVGSIPLDRPDLLVAVYAMILIMGTWSIWRILRRAEILNAYLNTVSLIAVIFPLSILVAFQLQAQSIEQIKSTRIEVNEPEKSQDNLPDIYYIILDSYGRPDFLEDYYDIDTTDFLDFLHENGFYVAEGSHSNYNQTSLSLASSLNYEYLDQLLSAKGSDSGNRQPLVRIIRDNRLAKFLKSRGYTFIAFSSSYWITEIHNADLYIDTSVSIFNEFEKGFLINTAAIFWFDRVRIDLHRSQLRNTITQLGRASEMKKESPRFFFAHILLPHQPFVFGSNGEYPNYKGSSVKSNGANPNSKGSSSGHHFTGTKEEYIDGYKGQLSYLNKLIKETIAQILANSEPDPIIILQGDHGPEAFLNWEEYNQTCFQERMGIFNAYHLPEEVMEQLYPGITPVNTFRVILNQYFDEDYPLLEDRVYFSKWSTPYQFVDVTRSADYCR